MGKKSIGKLKAAVSASNYVQIPVLTNGQAGDANRVSQPDNGRYLCLADAACPPPPSLSLAVLASAMPLPCVMAVTTSMALTRLGIVTHHTKVMASLEFMKGA